MTVKKGRVTLTKQTSNSNYNDVITIDIKVFEKTDGNYKEVIAKIIDNENITTDTSNGSVVYENHTADETYKIYPNMNLGEFYDSLLTGYVVNYTEELSTI